MYSAVGGLGVNVVIDSLNYDKFIYLLHGAEAFVIG
jgi:hypothetical protein